MAMAAGYRQIHEFERSLDRKLDELENLLRALATGRENPIAPISFLKNESGSGKGKIRSRQFKAGARSNLATRFIAELKIKASTEVFSRIGDLETIKKLDHESQFQWRVQFGNSDLALKAFESFNGRYIYDDCCRMELLIGRNTSEANEILVPIEAVIQTKEMKSMDDKLEQPTEDMRNLGSMDSSTLFTDPDQNLCYGKMEPMSRVQLCALEMFEGMSNKSIVPYGLPTEKAESRGPLIKTTRQDHSSELIQGGNDSLSKLEFQILNGFYCYEDMKIDVTFDNRARLIDRIEMRMNGFREILVSPLGSSSAYEVFDEMPNRQSNGIAAFVQVTSVSILMGCYVFDPGINVGLNSKNDDKKVVVVFYLGGSWLWSLMIFASCEDVVMLCDKGNQRSEFLLENKRLVFDPGGGIEDVHINGVSEGGIDIHS